MPIFFFFFGANLLQQFVFAPESHQHSNINAEAALRGTNAKFERRFRRIEDWLAEAGRTPQQSSLAEMDALWERAKADERGESPPDESIASRDAVERRVPDPNGARCRR